MSKLLASLGIIAFMFFACKAETSETAQESKSVQVANKTEAVNQTKVETRKPIWVKRDSTTPPPKPRPYSVSTSRPSSEIKKDYPYDIDFKKADGSVVKSNEVLKTNGKPTVLAFWLTTCVPCRYELAEIEKKYAGWKEKADFNFYAISTDFPKNYEKFVERVNEMNWPWEAYNDVNREFMHVMPGELNGLPQTFILDKDGKIVYHHRKYSFGDEDELFAKLVELNGR
ncbi:MAG: TlpA disulfide reductase family protein [Saprospiraceae bacterium]